jgi:hypothetical protein
MGMATELILRPGYDFGKEFEIGLDVILDALARLVDEQSTRYSHLTAR